MTEPAEWSDVLTPRYVPWVLHAATRANTLCRESGFVAGWCLFKGTDADIGDPAMQWRILAYLVEVGVLLEHRGTIGAPAYSTSSRVLLPPRTD